MRYLGEYTNSEDVASKAKVPTPSSSTPLMDGTASAGSSADYARGDHVHPTDSTRASATSVPASAVISNAGVITFSNADGTTLFTVQLPIYNGGVS